MNGDDGASRENPDESALHQRDEKCAESRRRDDRSDPDDRWSENEIHDVLPNGIGCDDDEETSPRREENPEECVPDDGQRKAEQPKT